MPWMLVAFLVMVLLFHLSELAFVAAFQRDRLTWRSALLSPAYLVMLALALAEFWLEWTRWPALKNDLVACLGLALMIVGDGIRKTGMLTAQRAFSHEIARKRDVAHRLVTHGIYRYVRHPGYLGWLAWAVGAQLLLVNPLTTVLAAIAAWRFFAARIPEEEALLEGFFPGEYAAYRRRTSTWLPFIG